ncbi:MAG: hypothetical protein NTY77_10175 [Elusimicrobia bacterium]|nr:hypothetical protein [Elusimicrobiota bacterium]
MRRAGYWLLAAWPLLLGPAACTCKGKPQEARSMAPVPETFNEKRKPEDFPVEKIEKAKDFERGEGLPEDIKKAVKKSLEKAKKPKTG